MIYGRYWMDATSIYFRPPIRLSDQAIEALIAWRRSRDAVKHAEYEAQKERDENRDLLVAQMMLASQDGPDDDRADHDQGRDRGDPPGR